MLGKCFKRGNLLILAMPKHQKIKKSLKCHFQTICTYADYYVSMYVPNLCQNWKLPITQTLKSNLKINSFQKVAASVTQKHFSLGVIHKLHEFDRRGLKNANRY